MIRFYWHRFLKTPMALLGAGVIGGLILTATVGPVLMKQNPFEQNLLERLSPPSSVHWMGTDDLGRDVLARVVQGSRVSLTVGLLAAGLSVFLGTGIGLFAGFRGRGWDAVTMRVLDVLLCFPTIFLILMVIAFLEPSVLTVMLVIGLTSWMGLARLVRGETLVLKERDFIWAARGLGLSETRILLVHLLPHLLSPVMVAATLGVGGAVLTESALSFLGLGVQPPNPSWGSLLSAGKDYIHMAWWLTVFPGLALFATVLGFNLLGEGFRDVLDPRMER